MVVAPIEEGGTFGELIEIPGAVSLTLEQKGEVTPFYADGVAYYIASSNGGYEGDFEVAMIPDKFREAILKEEKDANGVLFESVNVETKAFALGCQIDGDEIPTLFWFYNCAATRPSMEAKTVGESKEPDVDKLKLSCAPDKDGYVRAKTTKESYEKVAKGWFTEVYTKDKEAAVAKMAKKGE